MHAISVFCLLSMLGYTLAAKNALYGHDVLMHSDPKAPRMVLVDDKQNIFVDLSGTAFTWCVNAYLEAKEGKKMHTIFGYGSKEHKQLNEILLEVYMTPKKTVVTIRDKEAAFPVVPELNKWTLICFSWASQSGLLRVFFDAKEIGRKEGLEIGEKIGKEGVCVLGQDQDSYDGGYEAPDGVYGRLTQCNSWNRTLNDQEVQSVLEGKMYGNQVDWRESTWALAGNAVLLPTEAPNAAAQTSTCKGTEETIATDLSICLRFHGDSCAKEAFTLFYYMNSYGTKELSVAVNENRSTSVVVGTEEVSLPHLTVTPGSQHWCFVWSNGYLVTYMDGGQYDTLGGFSEGSHMSTNGDLYVHEANSRKRVKTDATDYQVWERALTREEVAEDYKQQSQKVSSKTYFISSGGISPSSSYVRRVWQQAPPGQFIEYIN